MIQRKHLRRLLKVLQNSANSLLTPIFNILVSLLLIRLASEAVWGAFIAQLIVLQLIAYVVGWGNKDYLLREFSRMPDQIIPQWRRSLTSRLLLLLLALSVLTFLPVSAWIAVAWLILIVIVQSFDVVVVYRRDFLYAIFVEVLNISIVVAVLVTIRSNITTNVVLAGFTLGAGIKAIMIGWRYRRFFGLAKVDLTYFKAALPFFLLGFSGILASRIDLYTVSVLLPEDAIGRYQVFINLMLYIQALSAFILMPFIKNIYRMPEASLLKLSRRMFALGGLLLLPALVAADLLFRLLYGINYGIEMLLLGGAFVLPLYGYTGLVYRLHSRDETGKVLVINLLGASGNFALNLLLLPKMGISGAILASAFMQWGIFAYYQLDVHGYHTLPATDDLTERR